MKRLDWPNVLAMYMYDGAISGRTESFAFLYVYRKSESVTVRP